MLIYPGRTDSATFTAVHFLRPDNTQITLTSKVDLLTSVISGDIRLATPLRVGDSGTWALARDCEAFRGLVARGERYKTRYLAYFALNVVLFGGLFAFTLTVELTRLERNPIKMHRSLRRRGSSCIRWT